MGILFLFVCFFNALLALGSGETYEVIFELVENSGKKIRKESVFEISKDGSRLEIQKRVYVGAKNELTEASFFDPEKSKWLHYSASSLPSDRKDQIRIVNEIAKKRPREAEDAPPLKLAFKANSEDVTDTVQCEKAGNEFVICEGIPYRKERSASVNTTERQIKMPFERRPAIIAPFDENSSVLPVQ